LLEVFSVTLQQPVIRFPLLETLTQLLIFYCFFFVFLTWKFSVFCIYLFACSHPFELSNRYGYAKVQLLLIKFNTRTPGKNIPCVLAMSIFKPSEF